MIAILRAVAAPCAALVFALSVSGPVWAQALSVSVEISSDRVFAPLQSYVHAEMDESLLFFSGLTDMGLHRFSAGAFPINKFNDQIVLIDKDSGDVRTADISHLSPAVQEALKVTAPAGVQFDNLFYMYGGYGPLIDGSDYGTRASVTRIDLAAVESAILANSPVPVSAFTVMAASEGQVAGGGIVKLSDGNRFALICGANAVGVYPHDGDPIYSEEVHIFDRNISVANPIRTFYGGEFGPLHRRDVNVEPVTLPDGSGGTRDGFVVVAGVFEFGIFAYENPLIWADGDSEVFEDETFTQHIGNYEGPTASLYSQSRDENHIIICSGLSAYEYTDGEFILNPSTPWTREITQMTIAGGVFIDDPVVGEMPWPVTNAHFIIEDSLPRNALGQVLVDQLPCNVPVLLGRIYGGIAAEMEGDTSPTWASDDVLEVFVRVEGDESALPQSFRRVRGLSVSGGLNDLRESDDSRLVTRPDIIGPAPLNSPAVQVEVTSTVSDAAPRALCIAVESRSSVNNILQRIRLFNYSTSQYETVYQGLNATSDAFDEVTIDSNPQRFVNQSDGEVKALIQHVAVAFSIRPTWTAEIDQVVWTVFE